MDQLFTTVLVANRGEIACRVISTLHRLGITAVAVHSEADVDAAHVRMADRSVCLGPAAASASYLDVDAVIEAARTTGAEAIHPGYGFLSENASFARACEAARVVFIGPGAQALEIMGDKIRAKEHVAAAGVPLVDGVSAPGLDDDALVEAAAGMTYPVLIKPSAGGGGKGMQVVERPEELAEALPAARRVAQAAFGDDSLMIEQLIRSPRHIEVQVLADSHGDVIHLGERECSLQRRHQKVIEEAPSPLLLDTEDGEQIRARLGEAACQASRSVDYRGAGTVEFLVSDEDPGTFFFMEMNTRLQVEHPVTEEITGVDLVEQQIRIAAGQPLALTQEDVRLTGHAVEARVYAEQPEAGFLPATGTLLRLHEPSGEGVRVDTGLRAGQAIGIDYDPMLAKVIAHAPDRAQALSRLHRALGQTLILGVETNLAYLRGLLDDDDVRAGRLDTTLIARRLPDLALPRPDDDLLTAAALLVAQPRPVPGEGWACDGWRAAEQAVPSVLVTHAGADGHTLTTTVPLDGTASLDGPATPDGGPGTHLLTRHGRSRPVALARGDRSDAGVVVWAWADGVTARLTVADRTTQTLTALAQREAELTEAAPEVTAPLPGTVIAVAVTSGDTVRAGDPLVTIEAMKMEHRLLAPFDGTANLAVAAGEQVSLGQVLATVTKEE